MNIKETASTALQFIDQGRAMAAAAVEKLDTADLQTSNAVAHEIEHALGTLEHAREILHATMFFAIAQYKPKPLPEDKA
jgi:hypothetical protein